MKKFLLIAGSNFYPRSDTEDWVRCFETYKEAEAAVSITDHFELFSKGPRKGQVKSKHQTYYIEGCGERDWYNIVDLEEWMNR